MSGFSVSDSRAGPRGRGQRRRDPCTGCSVYVSATASRPLLIIGAGEVANRAVPPGVTAVGVPVSAIEEHP